MVPRRKQIVDRAAAVVYRKGFGATTVSDVLAAAAVGKGNFYHYFEGKDDLGLAIIDSISKEIAGTPLDEVFSPDKEPQRRLRDYLQIVRTARRNDNSGDPLCTLASELGNTPPFAERIRAVLASLLERIGALVGEMAADAHAATDAKRAARILLAAIHGLCVQYKVDGDAAAFEAALAELPSLLHVLVAPARVSGLFMGQTRVAGR